MDAPPDGEGAPADASLRVLRGADAIGRIELRELGTDVDVNWSPDSRAFSLTWSDSGAVGGLHVRVFRVMPDVVTEVFPVALAEREFRRRHDCPARGINVFAVRWLGGSDRLLVATEVYPASDCGKEMGVTRGYAVRVRDGSILRRYSNKEIAREMTRCSIEVSPVP